MVARPALDEVLDKLYDAAASPQLWQPALEQLSDYLKAFDATMIFWNKQKGSVDLLTWAGRYSAEAVDLYGRYYGRLDPAVPLAHRAAVGQSVMCDELIDQSWVAKSEYYNDFLIPNGGR